MSIVDVYINLSEGKGMPESKDLKLTAEEIKGLIEESQKKHEFNESKFKKILDLLKIPFKGFNIEDYKRLLNVTRLSCFHEKRGGPEFFAVKLIQTFGSFDEAIAYLKRHEATKPNHTQPIYDACDFISLPQEPYNYKLWQALARQYMPDERFKDILRFAPKIEKYVMKDRRKMIFHDSFMRDVIQETKLKHERRLGNEWEENKQKEEKKQREAGTLQSPEDSLKDKLINKLEKQKATKMDKLFSTYAYKELEKLGRLPKSKDKKAIKEAIELFKSTDGKVLWEKIRAETTKKYEEIFNQEYEKLISPNLQKREYIEKGLKRDEALIKEDCRFAIQRILSKNTPLETLYNYFASTCYKNAAKHPAAASLFYKLEVKEEDFDRYINLKPCETSSIPDVFVDGDRMGYSGYYIKKLSSKDPRGAILGQLTSCCQWIGTSMGRDPTIHGITSSEGGFYVLCQKKGKDPDENDPILAQCWAWKGEHNQLVFDTVESQINFGDNNKRLLSDFFILLAHHLVTEKGLKEVNVGSMAALQPRWVDFPFLRTKETDFPIDYSGYRESTQPFIIGLKSPIFLKFYLEARPDSHLKDLKEIRDLGKPTLKDILEWVEFCAFNKKKSLLNIVNKVVDVSEIENCEIKMNEHYQLVRDYFDVLEKGLPNYPLDLINRGVDINLRDPSGRSILHYVIEKGSIEHVRDLIQRGIDVNIRNCSYGPTNGSTALSLAGQKGNLDIVKLLIENGADINRTATSNGETALSLAGEKGNLEVVKLLVEKGADVNKTNSWGDSALSIAARAKQLDIVKYLVENGARIITSNKGGKTAIEIAKEAGSPEIEEYLNQKTNEQKIAKESTLAHKLPLTAFEAAKTEKKEMPVSEPGKIELPSSQKPNPY